MKEKYKIILKRLSFGVIILIALLINPMDIYYSLKAEERMKGMVSVLIDEERVIEGETEIEYIGGGVYSIKTPTNQYLIYEEKRTRNHIIRKVFYEPSYFEK